MVTIIYDGSFEGWLTAVFEIYEYKYSEVHIKKEQFYQPSLLDKLHNVYTCEDKAQRVWKGLKTKLSPRALQNLYHVWLSEQKAIEDVMFAYVKYSFSQDRTIEFNYGEENVLTIQQLVKKVHREAHRMKAFVRFQLTTDNLYYALVDPDFNVLPLIAPHFKERYADQCWLIYDIHRKYGIYYDMENVEMVQLSFSDASQNNEAIVHHEQEALYQKLWQTYFHSTHIKARKNTKLHIQHMPVRYWKYLTEKKHFM